MDCQPLGYIILPRPQTEFQDASVLHHHHPHYLVGFQCSTLSTMRSFILIPTLALINMGANAATIGGAINRQTGGQLEVANRQLHNADFSSTTPDGSTPAPALGDSTGPSSATSPSAARRRVADLPAGVPPPVADALGKATDATMTTSTSKRDGNIAFGSLEVGVIQSLYLLRILT